MTITVKLAPCYAEITGKDVIVLTVPEGGTFADLCASIIASYPALDFHVKEATFLINNDKIAYHDTALSDKDALYMIMPIAGG